LKGEIKKKNQFNKRTKKIIKKMSVKLKKIYIYIYIYITNYDGMIKLKINKNSTKWPRIKKRIEVEILTTKRVRL
jgi:hypothetical protein